LKKFLPNRFSPPLEQLVTHISPSKGELARIQSAFSFFEAQVQTLHASHILPTAIDKNLIEVGSLLRQTAITPIKHFDVFFIMEGSQLIFSKQNRTLQSITTIQSYSPFTDVSGHISPEKCLQYFVDLFALYYPTSLTNSGQAVNIALEAFRFDIHFVPTFLYESVFLIPEGNSELHWVEADPFKELGILKSLDKQHKDYVTPTIKIAKYWNRQKNNSAFRDFHIETIAYLLFGEVPTAMHSLHDALTLFFTKMPSRLYNSPDVMDNVDPLHLYLPDKLDPWYLYMNRISEAKEALKKGDKEFIEYLISDEVE